MKILKTIRISAMLVSYIFLLISCQKEERELIDPSLDETISQDSRLSGLMKNVVTHDGSFDDLIDKGNCYSINVPYFIVLNGEALEINSKDDYNKINESDVIEIQFPIRITTHEYKEEFIETIIALEVLASSCKAEDDDIECIDFVYPFSVSTFNANTNVLSTVEVFHDAQVFEFMNTIDIHTVMSINYPIQLLLHNGEHATAGHNEELLSSILDFVASCDEND